jgi:hypothetical protein
MRWKVEGMCRGAVLVCHLLVLSAPNGALAAELLEGKLNLNVYGGAVLGYSRNNDYLAGDVNGAGTTAELRLAILGRPHEQLTLAGQLGTEMELAKTEIDFDWAFAEWRFSDAFRLRAGRNQLPLGLYREIQHVGTLHPFLSLPMSIYGPTEIGAENYNGLGVIARFEPGQWAVELDGYLGLIDVEEVDPIRHLLENGAETEIERLQVLGARIAIHTPIEGLRLLLSGYVGRPATEFEEGGQEEEEEEEEGEEEEEEEAPPNPFELSLVGGVSVDYTTERLLVRGEMIFARDEQGENTLATYVEVAGFVTQKLQLGARFELSRKDADRDTPDVSLNYNNHREFAFTVNYHFTPQFIAKLSYHNAFGNRLAIPVDLESDTINSADPRTHLFMLGLHFSL